MKKIFWLLFLSLFAAIIGYSAASKSFVSLGLDLKLALGISVFVVEGIGLGVLGGKARYMGVPNKKLPDKGEFLLRCAHELADYVLLSLLDQRSGKCLVYEIGKKQLLNRDGEEFSDFTKLPRNFVVMKREIGEENGPTMTVYYLVPLQIKV